MISKKRKKCKKLYLHILFYCIILFCSCENKTVRDQEGLIVYQENQVSWIRNFEPLNPVSICRWPTRGGILRITFLNNPITTDWVPWLATDYEWQNNNKKLLFTIRSMCNGQMENLLVLMMSHTL